VPNDLRVLSGESGLPPLPSVGIGVTVDSRQPSAVVSAFAQHVRQVLPTL
jgi:hypothetical protein